jgi:signal transduction histidine kinase/ligand-binding sensor domain-containing protein
VRNSARTAFIGLALAAAAVVAEPAQQKFVPPRTLDPYIRFERMPIPRAIVFEMIQDRRGFIWFATDSGLYRFDGYRARLYRPEPIASGLPASVYSTQLAEDASGAIWVSTDNGLGRVDPITGRFVVYRNRPGDPGSIARNVVNGLRVDRAGIVWAGTVGLDRIDPKTGTVTHFVNRRDDPTTISSNAIHDICEDTDGTLWLATNAGLDAFDKRTGRAVRFDPAPAVRGAAAPVLVNLVRLAEGNRLLVGTESGAVWFDRASHRFAPLLNEKGQVAPELLSYIRAVGYSRDGRYYWFGTSDGVVRYELATGTTQRIVGVPGVPGAFATNQIRSLLVDDAGGIWAAPQGDAVYRYDPGASPVASLRSVPGAADSLARNNMFGVAEDAAGALWVGTDGAGVDRVDPTTGQARHFAYQPGDPNSLPDNFVRSVAVGGDGAIWVATVRGGVARIDPDTNRVTRFQHDPQRPDGLDSNNVRTVYRDRQDRIWIGTTEGSLHRYDAATKTIHRVPLVIDGNRLYGVLDFLVGADGSYWIATYGHGLARVKPDGTMSVFRTNPSDPASLSGDSAWTICEDQQGTIWVGTSSGLDAIDPRTSSVRRYSEADRLASNAVRAIVEDRDRALWVATDRGLSRRDPVTGEFRTYTAEDGFVSSSFSYKTALRLRDGRLCFGGADGLILFDPSRLTENRLAPRVVLTALMLGSTVVDVGAPGSPLVRDIDRTDPLVLGPQHRSFAIEFSALNYRFPAKNQFRYRLDGFDPSPNWNLVDSTHREARYTGLPPGEYVLRVTGSNNEGIWNRTPRAIRIIIEPPWWRTRTAQLSYWMVGAGLVIGFVQLRTRAHRRELARQRAINEALQRLGDERQDTLRQLEASQAALQQLNADLERRVQSRTAQLEAANQELEAFSYSVSHDLRTPLRAIDGFSKLALTEQGESFHPKTVRYLGLVRESTAQMARLIDDLLAFSRLGRQPLTRREVDMRDLVERVLIALAAERGERAITISIGDLPVCDGDRALLKQVWLNLLGNALKFTRGFDPARIEVGSEVVDGVVSYFVRDTGAGFDMTYASKLFGVFQRLHTAEQYDGTGVGLAIVQRIVHRHGGRVWAHGVPNQGATFWFTIGRDGPATQDGQGEGGGDERRPC